MEIQDRIKLRRKALGLTLKDVAKALGVSEGTISRYESSDIQNMGVNKLPPLARVLQCSPVYLLMGWEDAPESTAASLPSPAPDLRSDEQELLQSYNSLNREGREKVRGYADDLKVSGRYIKSDPDPMVDTA